MNGAAMVLPFPKGQTCLLMRSISADASSEAVDGYADPECCASGEPRMPRCLEVASINIAGDAEGAESQSRCSCSSRVAPCSTTAEAAELH